MQYIKVYLYSHSHVNKRLNSDDTDQQVIYKENTLFLIKNRNMIEYIITKLIP